MPRLVDQNGGLATTQDNARSDAVRAHSHPSRASYRRGWRTEPIARDAASHHNLRDTMSQSGHGILRQQKTPCAEDRVRVAMILDRDRANTAYGTALASLCSRGASCSIVSGPPGRASRA